MLAPSLFRMGVFSRANVIAVLLSFAMFGLFFFVSLYLQNVRGYSPIQAGAAFLPMTVTMMLVAPVAGVGIARGGARWLTVTGLLLLAVSLSMFAGLDVHSSFLAICTPMTLAGAAIALALTPLLDLALGSVPADTLGVAAGVFNSARQVGGALGLAVMGAIVSSGVTSSAALGATAAQSFVRGFHHAVLCSAAVALCGAVVAFRIRPPATSPVASDPPVAELLRSTPLTHDGERSPLRQLATEAMDD